ncbi:MAG: DUF1207 domain-containing protein [Planctomycetes bacterium]|nr:DUF1207 domain-containing protein [Planctomycetota bacterium]
MKSLRVLAFLIWSIPSTVAAPLDDSFIAGYAAALLEREFNLRARSLIVKDGVITIRAEDLAGVDRAKVIRGLSGIPGAVRVEVVDGEEPPSVDLPVGWLPGRNLFSPLLADPRWPHFSAAYHYYIHDQELRNVGSVSFGETFALYRMSAPLDGQVELGLQAGVFAVFDLDADSKDLINADYFVSLFSACRKGDFSAIGRIFHQSSHLGDEFLLRSRVDRVNLSYESGDIKLSYELPFGFRLYGGGGFLFDQEPSDLKHWSAQEGIEFRSPWTFWDRRVRPIGAVDLKNHEEQDWRTDLSLRAGVQFDSLRVLGRNLQLLAHYFIGHSPNGQFYDREIEYAGLGLHFHF